MFALTLVVMSIISAAMSAALAVAYWVAMRRLGTLCTTIVPKSSPVVIDVIIPARNEERDLERAVRSILAQQSLCLRVTIVNDHSDDGTRAIAEELARADSRVQVIHDPPLSKGWLGKANAMQHGFSVSTAPYLLFCDADVVFSPECFALALWEMKTRRVDFLSLLPLIELKSFWENVLLPHAAIAGSVRFALRNVNDARSPSAAAAGAFMLTRREVLECINGLETVKASVMDDVMLARQVKQQGFVTRLLMAPNMLRVRLFKGNSDAFWGTTKNILGAVGPGWMAAPTMFLPIFVYWVPLITGVVGIYMGRPAMILAGFTAYAIQCALLLLVAHMCRLQWLKALCFPLAAIPVTCCVTKALYHHFIDGGVFWRGRVISVRPE